jgi:exonuclease III
LTFIENFDLIFLSETWLSSDEHSNFDINGFYCVHIFGSKSKNTKKGRHSGGITFYYRKQFKNYIHIVDKLKQGIIWVKISKEMLTLDEDVFICHCYIPPSDSKIMLNSDFDFHEKLEADIMKYENLGKVYVTGDMNCRTSNEQDFLSFDKYLDQNLPFVDKQNIPLRQNYDKVIDSNGRKLIDICLATGLLIANGRLENDEKGKYTFCSQRGASTVDYLLLHLRNFNTISHFYIHDFNEFSDHAPISFELRVSLNLITD